MSTPYPPAPWQLHGTAYGTVWLLKEKPDPRLLPPDFTLFSLLGRQFAMTMWVEYGEGSTLTYGELLCGVLGRTPEGIRACTTHIWVDSPVSVRAGNEMWGIPKEFADFGLNHELGTFEMKTATAPTVHSTSRPLLGLPGRIPLNLTLAQPLHGGTRHIRIRSTARISLGRQTMPEAAGAIPLLRGARSLGHVQLHEFAARFDA